MSFEEERKNLVESKERLKVNKFDNVNLTWYKNNFSKLFEKLIFDLETSEDDFFGNFLISLKRKFNFCLNAPISHQVINLGITININPLLFIDYKKEEMKTLIKHEVYHILAKHNLRSKQYLGKISTPILILSSDLVANKFCENKSNTCWNYANLNSKFGCSLSEENSFEENIVALTDYSVKNPEFLDALLSYFTTYSDKVFSCFDSDNDFVDLSDFALSQSDKNDMDLLDDFIREVTVQASSNSRGYLPAGFTDLIESIINPKSKISWQQILSRKIGSLPFPYKKTVVRRDRRQPNRLDLRGRISDRVSKIYVAIDTSGSISDQDISYFLSEIRAITRVSKADVTVIECDADIQKVYDINAQKVPDNAVEGRGGTSFTPVFQYLRKINADQTSILVYFTDGYGEASVPKFRGETIWVITEDGQLSVTEPRGKVLSLAEDTRYEKFLKDLNSNL